MTDTVQDQPAAIQPYTRVGYIGRTTDRDRVYVEIRITSQQGEMNDTEHNPVTEWTRVSVVWHLYYKGSRRNDIDGSSCAGGYGAEVTTPAPGWTIRDIRRLATLADEWHLNDMQAGCAHVTPVTETDRHGRVVPSLDLTPACPESGYRYGHAWLVKRVPSDVLAEFRAFGTRLDGEEGLKTRD